MTVTTWRMWAHDYGDHYQNFGERWWVKIHDLGYPIVEVELTLDPDGQYWGWREISDGLVGEPEMIQPHKGMFTMQFPYGPKAEQDTGKGEIVRLSVVARACPDVTYEPEETRP